MDVDLDVIDMWCCIGPMGEHPISRLCTSACEDVTSSFRYSKAMGMAAISLEWP